MPAVIGVVFVFLVGVIVWVIASNGGDGDAAGDGVTSTTTSPAVGDTAGDLADVPASTETTTPPPMPDVSDVTTTSTSTSSTTSTTSTSTTSTTIAPTTTAPGSDDGPVPGDLAIPDRPMERPGCDGSYITVLASAVGDQATAAGIANVLEQYPGSNYLRTDQTCPSLNPSIDGQPIYVVYLGPFAVAADACTARSQGPEGAYVRRLSDDLGPDHSVDCA